MRKPLGTKKAKSFQDDCDNVTCPGGDKNCQIENGKDIFISSGRGPPITGPCGVSYRPSENFAISSGHQPFVVEILVEAKENAVTENSPKCLGTILTVRHILSAGQFLNVYLVHEYVL